jgi:hypothetical protein
MKQDSDTEHKNEIHFHKSESEGDDVLSILSVGPAHFPGNFALSSSRKPSTGGRIGGTAGGGSLISEDTDSLDAGGEISSGDGRGTEASSRGSDREIGGSSRPHECEIQLHG